MPVELLYFSVACIGIGCVFVALRWRPTPPDAAPVYVSVEQDRLDAMDSKIMEVRRAFASLEEDVEANLAQATTRLARSKAAITNAKKRDRAHAEHAEERPPTMEEQFEYAEQQMSREFDS